MKQEKGLDADLLLREIRASLPFTEMLENEPMSAHCSFRAGGPARIFALPEREEELLSLCAVAARYGCTPFLLGNGTNVVFPDEGVTSLVIGTGRLQELALLPGGRIFARAGVPLSRLAAFACENSLAGLEFASGIPGSVGGGLLMNAGAYGGELKDSVESVRVCALDDPEIHEFNNSECGFGYRKSVFQSGGSVILSAVFHLEKGERETIAETMRSLNTRRREKQPLDLPSAGSAFRRPTGFYAAALIEECGLKGVRVGGAQVSEKHAGFIVNTGGATAEDLRALLQLVRKTVYEQKHIDLQPEIILV